MIQPKDIIKDFFNTGDFPTEAQFADFIDSMRHINDKLVELTADNGIDDEGELFLIYAGETEPVYTKDADGTYRLAFATNVRPISLVLKSNAESTLAAGGSLILKFVSTDGRHFRSVADVRQQVDGRKIGSTLGVEEFETEESVNIISKKWANIGGASGGYIINLKFV